jgi:hypothetical protein
MMPSLRVAHGVVRYSKWAPTGANVISDYARRPVTFWDFPR